MTVPSKIKGYQFIPPRRLTGDLAAGTAIAAAGSASEEVRIAGGSAFRVRATVAGGTATLRVVLLRHDQTTEISSPAAEELALTSGTEGLLEFSGLVGESYCKVTITADGAPITVTSVDVYQGDVSSAVLEGDLEIGAVELKDATAATRAKIGTVSALAESDAGIPTAAKILAGENHVGEVGFPYFNSSDTFTRPANTTAYAANDRLSATTSDTDTTALRSFTAARVAGGKGVLTSCVVSSDLTTFLPRLRIHLYTTGAPTTAIAGDNSAYAHYYANEGERIGWFDMPALALPGGTGTDMVRALRDDLFIPFDAAASVTAIYYAIEVLDAATPSSGQSFTLEFGGIQG